MAHKNTRSVRPSAIYRVLYWVLIGYFFESLMYRISGTLSLRFFTLDYDWNMQHFRYTFQTTHFARIVHIGVYPPSIYFILPIISVFCYSFILSNERESAECFVGEM